MSSSASSSSNPSTFETSSFVPDPQADIALRSSDGAVFLVRRISLQANSEVFDGMFQTSSTDVGEKDESSGLSLVKLEDSRASLDLLLRFIVPNQVRPSLLSMSFETARDLLQVGDKYGVELIKEIAFARLHALSNSNTLEVLNISLFYRDTELARECLSHFGKDYNMYLIGKNLVVKGQALSIASLPYETLQSLPFKSLLSLLKCEGRVLRGEATWAAFSKGFVFE